jgi:hypothetical protein
VALYPEFVALYPEFVALYPEFVAFKISKPRKTLAMTGKTGLQSYPPNKN